VTEKPSSPPMRVVSKGCSMGILPMVRLWRRADLVTRTMFCSLLVIILIGVVRAL